MTRTAAALASSIALAVAACGPAPAPPFSDVTFYWNFQDGDGNTFGNFTASNPGCGIANVDEVRVTYTGPTGTSWFTAPCTVGGIPGAMPPTPLPAGSYTFTLDGFRQGLIVYTAQGFGDIVNFPAFFLTLNAVFPNMDLWYELPVGQTCAGIAEIAFQLVNGPGQPGAVVEYSWENVLVACRMPPNNGFTMPSIPPGNYGYRFVSAVNAPMPGGQSVFQVCGLGYPPGQPLVQTLPIGNAYTAQLGFPLGTCP